MVTPIYNYKDDIHFYAYSRPILTQSICLEDGYGRTVTVPVLRILIAWAANLSNIPEYQIGFFDDGIQVNVFGAELYRRQFREHMTRYLKYSNVKLQHYLDRRGTDFAWLEPEVRQSKVVHMKDKHELPYDRSEDFDN